MSISPAIQIRLVYCLKQPQARKADNRATSYPVFIIFIVDVNSIIVFCDKYNYAFMSMVVKDISFIIAL